MYIVFEWLDWAWKDTQLQNVFQYLTNKFKHMNILKTQEPSWISEAWKEIAHKLKNGGFESPEEALDLYIQDRIEMDNIKKSNIKYGTILCSRWDYTTYAYQSIKQWDKKWFTFDEIFNKHRELEDINNPLLNPDITFFFDLPINITIERINSRLKKWEKKDFFEKEKFLSIAKEQYLKAIDYLRKKEWRKIFIINANRDIDAIFQEIKTILKDNII